MHSILLLLLIVIASTTGYSIFDDASFGGEVRVGCATSEDFESKEFVIEGWRYWENYVNERVPLIMYDTDANSGEVQIRKWFNVTLDIQIQRNISQAYLDLAKNNDILFAPEGINAYEAIQGVLRSKTGRVFLSGNMDFSMSTFWTALSNKRQFFNLLSNPNRYMQGLALVLDVRKVKTGAVFVEKQILDEAEAFARAAGVSGDFSPEALIEEVLVRTMEDFGIVGMNVFSVGEAADLTQRESFMRDFTKIREEGDSFVALLLQSPSKLHQDLCYQAIDVAREMDFMPAAFLPGPCLESSEYVQKLGQDVRYLTRLSSWFPELDLVDTKMTAVSEALGLGSKMSMRSNKDLVRDFETRYSNNNRSANEFVASAALQGVSLERGLQAAFRSLIASGSVGSNISVSQITTGEILGEAILGLDESLFSGHLSFDAFGQNNLRSASLMQFDENGNALVVSPTSVMESALIYPAPSWKERYYARDFFESFGDGLFFAVSILGILAAALTSVALILFHRHRVIRQANVIFLLLTTLGVAISFASVLTWMPQVTKASCLLRPWMFTLGFSLLIVPLFAKQYKVLRIWRNHKLKSQKTSNILLLGLVSLVLAFDIFVLILWTTISPLQPVLEVVDPLRPAFGSMVCESKYAGGVAFGWLLFSIHGLMLVVGALLGLLTRNVSFGYVNDSRYIAFSTYTIVVFGVVYLLIQSAVDIDEYSFFIVRSSFVVSVLLLFMIANYSIKFFLMVADRGGRHHHWNRNVGDGQKGSQNMNHNETVMDEEGNVFEFTAVESEYEHSSNGAEDGAEEEETRSICSEKTNTSDELDETEDSRDNYSEGDELFRMTIGRPPPNHSIQSADPANSDIFDEDIPSKCML